MATAISQIFENKVLASGLFFRLARVFLLVLLVILPWEAVTAAREIAMAGAAIFLALHLWFQPKKVFNKGPLFWPLLAYVAVAALSLVWAVDFEYSLRELRAEVLKGLVIFYTGLHYIDDEESLTQLWMVVLGGLSIMVVAGIIYFFANGGSLLNHSVRAGSLHNGYGCLSTYLVTVWPFLLLSFRAFDLKRYKKYLVILAPSTVFLVFLTYSRSAWVAITVQTGLYILILSRKRLKTLVILGLAFLLAVGFMFMLPGSRHGEKWHRLFEEPTKVGGTTGDLLTLWHFSYHELEKNPFKGIGLGRHSFSKAFPVFRATHQPLLWHAHNMFVDLALQTGIQGLLAIIWIMATFIYILWPNSPPEKNDKFSCFATAGFLTVIGFAMRNMTDDFFADDTALLFWLIGGLSLAACQIAAKNIKEKRPDFK